MIANSVLACCRSVGLVTEDASPRASKSTDHGQLPDIWKLPMAGYPLPEDGSSVDEQPRIGALNLM
jgi:hypothetical protein